MPWVTFSQNTIDNLLRVAEASVTAAITGASGAVLDSVELMVTGQRIDWTHLEHVAMVGALAGFAAYWKTPRKGNGNGSASLSTTLVPPAVSVQQMAKIP